MTERAAEDERPRQSRVPEVWRPRWGLTLISTCIVPLLVAATVALFVAPAWFGPVIGLLIWVFLAARVRRRSLSLDERGFVVQRDRYRLSATWEEVSSVRQRRLQHVLLVDELLLDGAQLEPLTSRGRSGQLPRAVSETGADKRVQVSVYNRRWRDSIVGDKLRARGLPI